MVNPPPIPADKDALEWLPRIQLAATQVVAHIAGGWQSSARRDALLSALFGPRDWITLAAIITLAHLAEENPEIESDVRDRFKTLSEFIPDGGYCCFENALFTVLAMAAQPDRGRKARSPRAGARSGRVTWGQGVPKSGGVSLRASAARVSSGKPRY
jgi:hypothetical protein